MSATNYTSIFHFHGNPILPPLIFDDEREMLRKYRQDAIHYERKQQEAKALKYSKLVGQVKDVLKRIEESKKNKSSKPDLFCTTHDTGGPISDASKFNILPVSLHEMSSYPISSTPFLQTSRSTEIHDLMASSVASTIRTVYTDQSSEFMDLPQAWNKLTAKMKENEDKGSGKSSAQRVLKMDTTFESSYQEYHKVFDKGVGQSNPSNKDKTENLGHRTQQAHYEKLSSTASPAPIKVGQEQEQLATTSAYLAAEENINDSEHVYQEYGYDPSRDADRVEKSTLCSPAVNQSDEDHELSDKENSHAQFSRRYEYPSAFLKQNLDTPEETTTFEDTLQENREAELVDKVTRSQMSIALSNTEEDEVGLAKNFAKLTACVKGFLTRALFKTNKVQSIIKTIEDTWSFSQDILKDGPKSMQEKALQERVSLQMKAAKEQLSDIFHKLPVQERMEILAISRQLNRDKEINKVFRRKDDLKSNKLSAATMKAMQRRQQVGTNNGSETAVKQEKNDKPEVRQPVNPKPKPKPKEPISIRKRTDIRVLKPIQSHSSPRLPPKTTKSSSTSEIGRINRKSKTKAHNSKHRGKSENVNTQVQTGAKHVAVKRVVDASDKKQRANTVPRTNNAIQRTTRQLPARQLPVNRRMAASITGNQS